MPSFTNVGLKFEHFENEDPNVPLTRTNYPLERSNIRKEIKKWTNKKPKFNQNKSQKKINITKTNSKF